MDYFVMQSLEHHVPRPIQISYDIACQWHVKLWERAAIYPWNVFSDRTKHDLTFLVPKFHLPAHVQSCQLSFSHNLIPRVGRTDGEAPERGWAKTNRLSYSTREMGPGSRRDTMDDEFGDMNWVKYVDLGKFLGWDHTSRSTFWRVTLSSEVHSGFCRHVAVCIEDETQRFLNSL